MLAPGRHFRLALAALSAAAFTFSFAELLDATQGAVVVSLLFAAWCTSPVLFWLGWGLTVADEGRTYRGAVAVIGALALPTVVGFHPLIAASSSPTAGVGYLTIPFPLLAATAIATVCANSIAARQTDSVARPGDDGRQLLDDFQKRIDGLGSR